MKKNAFTLIELLAVIVILAIIALIAVPVLLNIINDTKTSSGEEAVKLYIDSVKKAISRKQLEDTSFNPTECTIQDNGNLLCNDIKVTIDMKGIKPNKGIIEIKDNQVTYKNLLLNGTYYNRLVTPVQDNNNNGKPDIGDKYTYKVNDTDTFNFYVLSFNEDDTVNLIMDRNICNDGKVNYTEKNNYCRYAWHAGYGASNNNYGPDTAMQELYKGTKNWNNVPSMELSYIDEHNNGTNYGYTGITIINGIATIEGKNGAPSITIGTNDLPLKTRLPSYIEIYKSSDWHCMIVNNCATWLLDNLAINLTPEEEDYLGKIYGYWLLSSQSDGLYYANRLDYKAGIAGYGTANNATSNGIRPVITIPIDYLSS